MLELISTAACLLVSLVYSVWHCSRNDGCAQRVVRVDNPADETAIFLFQLGSAVLAPIMILLRFCNLLAALHVRQTGLTMLIILQLVTLPLPAAVMLTQIKTRDGLIKMCRYLTVASSCLTIIGPEIVTWALEGTVVVDRSDILLWSKSMALVRQPMYAFFCLTIFSDQTECILGTLWLAVQSFHDGVKLYTCVLMTVFMFSCLFIKFFIIPSYQSFLLDSLVPGILVVLIILLGGCSNLNFDKNHVHAPASQAALLTQVLSIVGPLPVAATLIIIVYAMMRVLKCSPNGNRLVKDHVEDTIMLRQRGCWVRRSIIFIGLIVACRTYTTIRHALTTGNLQLAIFDLVFFLIKLPCGLLVVIQKISSSLAFLRVYRAYFIFTTLALIAFPIIFADAGPFRGDVADHLEMLFRFYHVVYVAFGLLIVNNPIEMILQAIWFAAVRLHCNSITSVPASANNMFCYVVVVSILAFIKVSILYAEVIARLLFLKTRAEHMVQWLHDDARRRGEPLIHM
jgi:hypothetical protein